MSIDRYQTLRDICDAFAWATEPDVVYQNVCEAVARCLGANESSLLLFEEGDKRFVRHAHFSDADNYSYNTNEYSYKVGRMAQLIEEQDIIVFDNLHPHAGDILPAEMFEAGLRIAASIPLIKGSSVLGMVNVVYRDKLPFDQEDFKFLRELGATMGVLVDRVLMARKNRDLQMLLERKRLSSEIHDNIAQMVSALGIKSDVAIDCLECGDIDSLSEELEELSDMARQVTKMLRSEMLTLRTPLQSTGDVVEGIMEYVERFEKQWGIEVEVDRRYAGPLTASDYARLQLVRIVNECLQNVMRHAKADHVFITLDKHGKYLAISISDDGCGFDVERVAPERLGLRIMRERASSAGGALSIVSGARGTKVTVEIPSLSA